MLSEPQTVITFSKLSRSALNATHIQSSYASVNMTKGGCRHGTDKLTAHKNVAQAAALATSTAQ